MELGLNYGQFYSYIQKYKLIYIRMYVHVYNSYVYSIHVVYTHICIYIYIHRQKEIKIDR